MIEFGNSLRAAREAKGLTIAQVAEATHLGPLTVEELENEDFSHIAAAIYGRGFVKFYCEAVGLEPKPFVDEFMELFTGNHDTGIKERKVAPPARPPKAEMPKPITDIASLPPRTEPSSPVAPAQAAAPVAPEQPVEPPRPPAEDRLFEPKPASAPSQPEFFRDEPLAPTAAQISRPFTPQRQDPLPEPSSGSRYAPPIRQPNAPCGPRLTLPKIPTSVWRICILSIAALVVLAILFFGIRMLYRMTTGSREAAPTSAERQVDATPVAAALPQQPAKPAAEPSASAPAAPARTPQKIPSLYVD